MKKHISQREHASKITQAALSVIDDIKRRREPGLIRDTEIAVKIGCSPQAVSNWRLGSRAITIDQLAELVLQFKVNANWLITQEGSPWTDGTDDRLLQFEKRLSDLEKAMIKPTKKAIKRLHSVRENS